MPNNNYSVRLAASKDTTQIFDIFYNNFDKDEPLIKSLLPSATSAPPKEEIPRSVSQEELLKYTLVAEEDGEIIGLALSEILELGQQDKMYTETENYSDENVRYAMDKIHPFLDHIGRNSTISSHFPNCSKGILLEKLYVNPSQRGKGIAKKLIEETR